MVAAVTAPTAIEDIAPVLPYEVDQENIIKFEGYLKNPDASYNPSAQQNGVKANFAGTPNTSGQTDSGGQPCKGGTSSKVISTLSSILEEAKSGAWRETGQGGKPSNPKIVNIWRTLGYGGSNYWESDQTPWCAGFVMYCLNESGMPFIKEAGARATIQRAGQFNAKKVPIGQMQPGDIVLWDFGHVNFVYQANNGRYNFVGGNQTPTAKTSNPNDGDVTISWSSGWTPNRGGITDVIRPAC